MNLDDVHRGIQKNKKRKRVGRGPGSGHGKTSSRGHKGQKSRSGWSASPIFQGGAMPLVRRVPKRGFNNKFALSVVAVNVGDLERVFEAGDDVNPDTLKQRSLAKKRYDVLKILGNGELSKKLNVSAHRFSKSAQEKIEQAGGTITVLAGKKPVVKNKQASAKSAAADSAPVTEEAPASDVAEEVEETVETDETPAAEAAPESSDSTEASEAEEASDDEASDD
jgi:large subunit ribosomal protein L15